MEAVCRVMLFKEVTAKMSELQICLEELMYEYPDFELKPGVCGDEILQKLPEPLREFYSMYDSADFPFGHIFSAEEALNDPVAKQAFADDGWFEFGCDEYFSFWLCRFKPDGEGLWFDPWDHDSETDPEPAFADLPSFLRAVAEDYENFG